jgi:hypothetical protein
MGIGSRTAGNCLGHCRLFDVGITAQDMGSEGIRGIAAIIRPGNLILKGVSDVAAELLQRLF